jgi:hypothetical protein
MRLYADFFTGEMEQHSFRIVGDSEVMLSRSF